MSVKMITTDELRHMKGDEGLILQGCGGNLDEWVEGINDMFTDEGILKEGSKFENCLAFENNGVTCLLFPFKNVKIETGKLAIWRLKTHETFGGTWLSDYVPNVLGGFVEVSENPMTYDDMQKRLEHIIGDESDIYTSPDFQCDQTGGFPTSLCVCWDKGKAWLELNRSMIENGEDVSYYEQLCADFGIQDCQDEEQFNDILQELGEDAYENAQIVSDDEGMVML